METTTDTHWSKIYAARWGKHLAQDEIDAWEGEILFEVPNVCQSEMTTAMRDLAVEARRKGEGKYPITANNLISRIIKMRGEARQTQAAQEQPESCPMCIDGWLSVAEVVDTANNVIDVAAPTIERNGRLFGNGALPCICRRGEDHITKGRVQNVQSILHLRAKAVSDIQRTMQPTKGRYDRA